MKIVYSSILSVILLASLVGIAAAGNEAQGTIPTFTIVNVIPDQQVTIQTQNFPPNQIFRVLMGKFGTLGIKGTEVDKTDSGTGGSFSATYNIPPEFAGEPLVAIRLESDQGFFSYNWFVNAASPPTATATSASNNEGAAVTSTPEPTTSSETQSPTQAGVPVTASTSTPVPPANIPTFKILSVIQDQNVTIETANFPAGQTFTATMGAMGTRGVGGIPVGQVDSGSGGVLQFTFIIPSEFAGQKQIAIRLQSPQGFFAYNWFWNFSTP